MLLTERLTLRPHALADLPDSVALWGDPEVTRYISGRPFTPEEVWGRLLRHAGHWALLGYGYWVVRERLSGAFVGEVGLGNFHRDLTPPLDAPEAGWVLSPVQHGHGYATEAVRAVIGWAKEQLGSDRLVCIIDPEHAASLRVAERCGFRVRGTATYQGSEILTLERP